MTAAFHLTISPRDPVIARDGRPAATGLRLRCLDWPYPSVLAGSLRTLIGQSLGGFSSDRTAADALVAQLKMVSVGGPLPYAGAVENGELVFPAPLDVTVRDEKRTLHLHALRPSVPPIGAGCDLPGPNLFPVTLPQSVPDEFKPGKIPAFWSASRMAQWLANTRGESFLEPADRWPSGHYDALRRDVRFHTAIDAEHGVAERAKLFMTSSLDCARLLDAGRAARDGTEGPELSIVARIEADEAIAQKLATLSQWSPFGGERRIAHWSAAPVDALAEPWSVPAAIKETLHDPMRKRKYVRMVLATPALFSRGWLPGWLESRGTALRGTVPGTRITVRLIGAVTGRWKAISGWSFEHRAEKPARRLVPAGSVYFFEVEDGAPAELTNVWLRPVSDDRQDCLDGFGLALWGVWEPFHSDDNFDESVS